MAESYKIAPKEDRTLLGIVTMALAATCFTGIDSSAKWLILSGLPVLQVIFIRFSVQFVLCVVGFVAVEGPTVLRSASPRKQLLRSSFLVSTTALNFVALQFLPITVTTTIVFSGPIMVTLLAALILRERVGLHRLGAVCMGFFGVVVVMQPWGAAFHPAVFISVAAVAAAALYFIMTRMLAGVERNGTGQIWSSGLGVLAFAPFAFSTWHWPEAPGQYVMLLVLGCFGTFGHVALTAAHRLADASILAPVIYLQMFLATVVGVLVFDTWPTIWTLVGGAIIVASGIYIWRRERTLKARGAR